MRLGFGQVGASRPQIYLIDTKAQRALGLENIARQEGWEDLIGGFRSFFGHGGPAKVAQVDPGRMAQIPWDDVQWLAPIQEPQRVFAAAVNYRAHGAEAKIAPPPAPFLFIKLTHAFTGPYATLRKPAFAAQMDYEVELGVMIGKPVRDVAPDAAWDAVAGYLVINDISFRDLQIPNRADQGVSPFGQDWLHGKGLDASSPAGPFVVTRDEAGDGPFRLQCAVNGETVQDGQSSEMIFDVPHLLAAVSRGVTLLPGDVISTGTPAGVALGKGGPFLQPGDEVISRIEGLGTLKNRVVEE